MEADRWWMAHRAKAEIVSRIGPHRVYVETDAERFSAFAHKPPAEDHVCLPTQWALGLRLQYYVDPLAWCRKHGVPFTGEAPMVGLIAEMARDPHHPMRTTLPPGRRAGRIWKIGRRLAECTVHAYYRPVGPDVVYLTPEPCPEHVRQVGPDWVREYGWWNTETGDCGTRDGR